jgi:hypothetical protein
VISDQWPVARKKLSAVWQGRKKAIEDSANFGCYGKQILGPAVFEIAEILCSESLCLDFHQ